MSPSSAPTRQRKIGPTVAAAKTNGPPATIAEAMHATNPPAYIGCCTRRYGPRVTNSRPSLAETVWLQFLPSVCLARHEVAFGGSDTLTERPRRWNVDDLHTGAWANVYVDAVKAGVVVQAARADCPHLPRRKRIGADSVFALQLRGGNKLLDAILPQDVAEVGGETPEATWEVSWKVGSEFPSQFPSTDTTWEH
jgi:hypothetical protein